MIPEMDWSMFDPWELMTAMQTMSPEELKTVGPKLDAMGWTKDVVSNAAATGVPLPPPGGNPAAEYQPGGVPGLQQGGMVPGAPAGGASAEPGPPVPQTGLVSPPQYRSGGLGEQEAPDMTSAAPSFTPPASLGGLVYPSKAPLLGNEPGQAPPGADVSKTVGPAAPDGRTQAQRALAAQQGIKAPQEQKPMHQDLRQAPAPPKQADVKVGATAVQALLAAALSGGGASGLKVPTLGALAMGRR